MASSGDRAIIAAYVRSQADWRDRKAEEHPDDIRNRWAADGLRDLAAYIEGLADDDERIRELATMWRRGDVFSPYSETSRAISQFRFHDRMGDCGVFLTALVRISVSDAVDFAREAGMIE